MTLRLAVVSGYPPDPQGEANYAGFVYRALADRHGNAVTVRVFAHAGLHRVQASVESPNLVVEGITGQGDRRARAAAIGSLGDRLLEWQPDVVHLQGAHTPLYGGRFGEPVVGLLRRLRRAGIPIAFTVHSTWFREELDSLWRAKGLRGPLVWIATAYYLRFMRQVLTLSDVARVLTAGDGGFLVPSFAQEVGVPADRLIIEPHPCAPTVVTEALRQSARQALGHAGARLIVATGFVRPDKNLHTLLAAARGVLALHEDVRVVIAGQPLGPDGEAYASTLQSVAASLPQGRVDLRLRYVDDLEFGRLLDAAEIVVIPYGRSIGASGPVHHALARGRAVVASDLGHNRPLADVVSLVNPHDPDSLSDALERLVSSPEQIAVLEQRALEYARAHTWDALAEAYWQDYTALAERAMTRRIPGAAAMW